MASAVDGPALEQTLAQYNERAECPLPALSPRELQRVLAGDVVKLVRSVADGQFQVFGLSLVDQARAPLWVASQDPHFAGESTVLEALVEQTGDRAIWYGFLDLPRPFHDRHWVVENWNNHSMARSSDNRFWEHPWRIKSRGLERVRPMVEQGRVEGVAPDTFDGAVVVPVNTGAWAFIALSDEQTLLAGNTIFSLGGHIPERLVAEFMGRLLERHLVQLEELAGHDAQEHYRDAHPPVLGGDGLEIPIFP